MTAVGEGNTLSWWIKKILVRRYARPDPQHDARFWREVMGRGSPMDENQLSVQTGKVNLELVAKQLYGLKPTEFTAARDDYASEARRAGDRALADAIRSLRKPSVGAWLANLLVRERPSDIEALIRLGAQLRQAQDRLDGDNIRRLSNERHERLTVLLREAQGLAQRAHQPVSSAAMEDLGVTLDAALAEQEAAEALCGGRLTAALHYSGLGLADIAPDKRASGRGRPEAKSTSKEKSLRAAADRAQHEFERANTEAQAAHDAVATADAKLKQLKANAELADRRAKDAQKKAREAKRRAELARRPN